MSLKGRWFLAACCVLFSCLPILGCKPTQKRPYGYHSLGLVRELLKPETYFPEHRLLLRLDDKGFFVMSTACTIDSTALQRLTPGLDSAWESSTTDSKFDSTGKVIHGPATDNLPYYELKFGSSEYGAGEPALYAYVGNEVSATWRLKVKE